MLNLAQTSKQLKQQQNDCIELEIEDGPVDDEVISKLQLRKSLSFL